MLLISSALATLSAQSLEPDDSSFANIDAIMNKAVADDNIPGGVVLVGHNGKVVYRKAFGSRSLEPEPEAMTADTIFDLASLTKCIATATSVMKLIEDGRVRLNDPVAAYLPEFAQNGKKDITVRELMTHYSGLAPDLDLKIPWQGRDAAFQMAMAQTPMYPPGSRFVYSDINFETLGFLLEKVSGMPLNEFAAANVFKPLGMAATRFLPPAEWSSRIAPTQYDEQGRMLRGVVHDPTARRMGGVAGHAGLFSTADDLAKYAENLLNGDKVLSRLTIEKMSTPQQPANAASLRGARLGHRFALRQQPRRVAAGRVVWTYRLLRDLAVDRSGDRHVPDPADECGASKWKRFGRLVAFAPGDSSSCLARPFGLGKG